MHRDKADRIGCCTMPATRPNNMLFFTPRRSLRRSPFSEGKNSMLFGLSGAHRPPHRASALPGRGRGRGAPHGASPPALRPNNMLFFALRRSLRRSLFPEGKNSMLFGLPGGSNEAISKRGHFTAPVASCHLVSAIMLALLLSAE